MAAIAFDTLKFARKLIQAGMPDQLAEAQAEVMAEAFLFNVDALVTRDYLDARLGELEVGMEARFFTRVDARFEELKPRFDGLDSRFDGLASRFDGLERRFDGLESHFDGLEPRFDGLDSRFDTIDGRFTALDQRLAGMDVRFEQINGKFHLMFWMLAVITASTVIPALDQLVG